MKTPTIKFLMRAYFCRPNKAWTILDDYTAHLTIEDFYEKMRELGAEFDCYDEAQKILWYEVKLEGDAMNRFSLIFGSMEVDQDGLS